MDGLRGPHGRPKFNQGANHEEHESHRHHQVRRARRLRETQLPIPEATPGTLVVRVRAFGLNHAEAYFRKGAWGDVPKVTGIECAGEVHDPGSTALGKGQRVFALMGGMGRTIDGSYAEYVRVPVANVVPFESTSEWTELAAIPESYATAWTFLRHNLEAISGQVIVVRGGTSALGQATINIARGLDVRVLATTRSRDKAHILERLGASIRSRWSAIGAGSRWPASSAAGCRSPWTRSCRCRAACSSVFSRAHSCSAARISRSHRYRSRTSWLVRRVPQRTGARLRLRANRRSAPTDGIG